MAEARSRFVWDAASALMAHAANLHAAPKKGRLFKASDFNPYAPKKAKIVLRGAEMKEALKAAFVRRPG